ncbi:MAG: hydrogenase nickel incorporation protein HypB [Cellvibrionaceae bacterium]|nr:hydrogenase nickel incorporation protein HypB [Cellvibrionaceae bacterium]
MCTVCGCSDSHEKHQHHHRPEDGCHHYGKGPARAHAPGISQAKMIQVERDILGKNDEYARANRARLARLGILSINLVSSPGSGKTTLLSRTLNELKAQMPLAVIEGDQETSRDAQRIRQTGVPAVQINTGKGCHLDAHQIGHAVTDLNLSGGEILMIENVGNLVCPAAFDLGEDFKVAILSTTEGEDKPIKYPDMFHAADLLLLNKIDLLPHLDFEIEQCMAFARQVNPGIRILALSASSGEGLDNWYQWLRLARQSKAIGSHQCNESQQANKEKPWPDRY